MVSAGLEDPSPPGLAKIKRKFIIQNSQKKFPYFIFLNIHVYSSNIKAKSGGKTAEQ